MGPQNPNGRHGSMRLLSNLIFVCTLVVFCTSVQGKSNSMFKINFASLNLEIPKESICSVEVHNLTMAAMTLFVNQQDECIEVGITYLPESNVSGGLAKKLGLKNSDLFRQVSAHELTAKQLETFERVFSISSDAKFSFVEQASVNLFFIEDIDSLTVYVFKNEEVVSISGQVSRQFLDVMLSNLDD